MLYKKKTNTMQYLIQIFKLQLIFKYRIL